MHGDGYCDDKNNNKACFFDGGDCCGSNVNTDYCTECHCHCNASSDLIGNGVCNDELNTAECSYDSMDCCATCQKILVILENDALVFRGHLKGIYHKSSMVNGYLSWTSTSNAIWGIDIFWYFGPMDDIGENHGWIIGPHRNQCPFNMPSVKWKYFAYSWINAKANEISINCIDGNFFLQKSNCRCSRQNCENVVRSHPYMISDEFGLNQISSDFL